MPQEPLTFSEIRRAFDKQPLFEDKTWRISPEPWPLTKDQVSDIKDIGRACLEFFQAMEVLYTRSVQGKNLLRNKTLIAPWAAEYLDRGKPSQLIDHSRSKRLRGRMPALLRPDLLLTDDGFALTEIDSVPGGIGLTGFLNRLYQRDGVNIVGGNDRMVTAFYETLASQVPDKRLPLVAILVSDEAATYRPEMQWLAQSLRELGKRVYCLHTSEVMPLGKTLCASIDGNPEQIDIVYRFWELFDLSNVPIAEYILQAWEDSELVVSPPMRHFQEEKLSLALFHHHLLEDFWREHLSKDAFKILRAAIPKSWIIEPVDLPPNAVLDAPEIGGRPIRRWEQLGDATQKERNLIIKMSGFHENAWGARSVIYGSDTPRPKWQKGIENALADSSRNLHLLQEYSKPHRLRHPVYSDPDTLSPMEGRLRLCPYFFVKDSQTELAGILATFCPSDKKIIHGMTDAALLPCQVVDGI